MFIITLLVLAIVAGFTARVPANAAAAPLSVYVVNYPLQYFAQRIGGPEVRVTFPAPADGDPAFWKPSPEQILAYQKADLILLNGASYAKWVSHVSLPASRMVDTSASLADQFIPLEDQVSHSHGLAGKHEHGDVAFTTWLDPRLAMAQARAIRDALVRKRPGSTADFNQRFDALEKDLIDLDHRLMRQGPRNIANILDRLQSGKLKIIHEHEGLKMTANRVVTGMLLASLFIGSSLLLTRAFPPLVAGISAFGAAGYFCGVILGAKLLWIIRKELK